MVAIGLGVSIIPESACQRERPIAEMESLLSKLMQQAAGKRKVAEAISTMAVRTGQPLACVIVTPGSGERMTAQTEK